MDIYCSPIKLSFGGSLSLADGGLTLSEAREAVGLYEDTSRDAELAECIQAAREIIASELGNPWPFGSSVTYSFDREGWDRGLPLLMKDIYVGVADGASLTVEPSYYDLTEELQTLAQDRFLSRRHGYDLVLMPVDTWPSVSDKDPLPVAVKVSVPTTDLETGYGSAGIRQALRVMVSGLYRGEHDDSTMWMVRARMALNSGINRRVFT